MKAIRISSSPSFSSPLRPMHLSRIYSFQRRHWVPWLLLVILLGLPTVTLQDQLAQEETAGNRTTLENVPVAPLPFSFPSEITLRAAVLHAPPFAFAQNSSGNFTGFQLDLMERLQQFAAQDNVDLRWNISHHALTQYDAALNLVAHDCQVEEPDEYSLIEQQQQMVLQQSHPDNHEDEEEKYVGCNDLDIIIGNYYATPERSMRAKLTPTWLKSTIATMKLKDPASAAAAGESAGESAGEAQKEENHVPTSFFGGENVLSSSSSSSLPKQPLPQQQQPQREYNSLTDITVAAASLDSDDGVGSVKACLKAGTFYARLVQEKFPTLPFQMCASTEECLTFLKTGRCVLHVDDELQLHYRASLEPMTLEVTRERFHTQWIVWPMRHDLDTTVVSLLNKWLFAASINATMDDLYQAYFHHDLCPAGTAGPHCDQYCHPENGAADVSGKCVCKSIRFSGADCSFEVPEDTNLIPQALEIVAYCLLAINVAAIGGCATWLWLKRRSAPVRCSQPYFLWLVLLGCLISSCTIVPLAAQDDHDNQHPPQSCMAIPWMYSVGFSVTFGTLFAKILRVYHIFRQAAEQARYSPYMSRHYFVTIQEIAAIIGIVLLIDVAILVTWNFVDPLTWERVIIREDQFGAPLESEGYCTSDSWVIFGGLIGAYHISLLAVACFLCYKARDIPTKFSEGKYVSFAVVSHLQIMIVGVPILIIVGSDPKTSFFVRSVVVWMNDLAVILLIFGNLMYSVYFMPQESFRQSVVKREISAVVSQLNNSTNSANMQKAPSLNHIPTAPITPFDEHEENPFGGEHFGSPASFHNDEDDDDEDNTPNNHDQKPEIEPRPKLAGKTPRISSLSLQSSLQTSSNASSRKSVSWGMAYYSESDINVDSRCSITAVPIPSHDLKEEHTGPKADPDLKFTSYPVQGAPQRPPQRPHGQSQQSTAQSPEPNQECRPDGPVMPTRKQSVAKSNSDGDSAKLPVMPERKTSLVEEDAESHDEISPPRPLCDDFDFSSGMFTETDSSACYEEDLTSLQDEADGNHYYFPQQQQHQPGDVNGKTPLNGSRHSVETAQGAPTPPNRRRSSNFSLQSLGSTELSESSDEEENATEIQ